MKKATPSENREFRFAVTLHLLSAALVVYAMPIPSELVSSDIFSLVAAKLVVGLFTATMLTPLFVLSCGVTKLKTRKIPSP